MKRDDRVKDLAARVLELEGLHCTPKDRMVAYLQAAVAMAKAASISHSKWLSYSDIVFTIAGTPTEDEMVMAFDNTAAVPAASAENTRAYTAEELAALGPPAKKPGNG